uniref:Uncharacterized protein orf211 n=1 Tax=Glaucocystis nostochinearum TaxID=38271 RepID=E9P6D0_9EUKA|nr:hypothetical protein GlnoM_p14 [Glaucocystis nostochinearum]ADW83114.1 hypothetical protein [Glaucocystis nostochinearum]
MDERGFGMGINILYKIYFFKKKSLTNNLELFQSSFIFLNNSTILDIGLKKNIANKYLYDRNRVYFLFYMFNLFHNTNINTNTLIYFIPLKLSLKFFDKKNIILKTFSLSFKNENFKQIIKRFFSSDFLFDMVVTSIFIYKYISNLQIYKFSLTNENLKSLYFLNNLDKKLFRFKTLFGASLISYYLPNSHRFTVDEFIRYRKKKKFKINFK